MVRGVEKYRGLSIHLRTVCVMCARAQYVYVGISVCVCVYIHTYIYDVLILLEHIFPNTYRGIIKALYPAPDGFWLF